MIAELIIALIGVILTLFVIWIWWKFFDVNCQIETLNETIQKNNEDISGKIRNICPPQEVIPHYNIIEEHCKVYKPDDSLLCVCDNELTLLDIQCQIARKKLEGYYVIKDGIIYKIFSDGRLDTKGKQPPFTKYDDYMKELMGF